MDGTLLGSGVRESGSSSLGPRVSVGKRSVPRFTVLVDETRCSMSGRIGTTRTFPRRTPRRDRNEGGRTLEVGWYENVRVSTGL